MALPDFQSYSDEKLEAARLAIACEKERRDRLATIPSQVATLATTYTASGGDPADLAAALDGNPT